MQGKHLHFEALTGLPMVRAGDDLAALICTAAERAGIRFVDGDILVVAQKIVSKAEGRIVKLADVIPSPAAVDPAREREKNPRLGELVLRESTGVLRKKPGVIIVRHRLGIVGAQAGIDQSNVEHDDGEAALLLPLDPDASAARLRATLSKLTGKKLGIIISDSMNRPWRLGTIGGAIGCAGIGVLDDRRGQHDIYGRGIEGTVIKRPNSY